MSHSFSIMLLDIQSLHLVGVAGHAVLSFLALVLDCLQLLQLLGLGPLLLAVVWLLAPLCSPGTARFFWLLSRFFRVFHEPALLFPHDLFHPPYAFTYSVTFSSYPFLLPFSLTDFVLLSLNNLYKHHRSTTTIQEKRDPCCPQFREGNVSTQSAVTGSKKDGSYHLPTNCKQEKEGGTNMGR